MTPISYEYDQTSEKIHDLHLLLVRFWIENRYVCRVDDQPGIMSIVFDDQMDAFEVKLKYSLEDLITRAMEPDGK